MSSNRCSKFLLSLLVAVVVVAGAAGAISISEEDVPDEAQVGEKIEATFTFSELYQDPQLEEWTLEGETDMEDVTWTVTLFDQAGDQIDQQAYDGESFEHDINIENDAAEIRVRIVGTVPEVENFSYDPEQRFLLAGFQQVREGGVESDIETFQTHHFTEDSKEARDAIDAAAAAIEDAGGNEEAETILSNAISAYQASNFGNAVDLANQARDRANRAQQGQQQTQLLLMAGGGVVVLLVIVGAVYLYRQRQTTSKL